MTEKIEVPNEVLGAYNRIMNKVPREVRNDRDVQRTILTFLKVGGLRLGSHYIDYKKLPFSAEFNLVKKRPVDVPAKSSATPAPAAETKTDPSSEKAPADDQQASSPAEAPVSGGEADGGDQAEARPADPAATAG